ncbi:MAG: Bro-N domain-containing protein [Succinivibrio sp.]
MIKSNLPARQDQFFNFQDKIIRTVIIDGTPWFCAKDVCGALGYLRARDAISLHVFTEDAVKHRTLTKGGNQLMTYINESGVYALIFGSKLPAAKEFKKWVTSEVLPALRKEGQYSVNNSLECEEQRHQSHAIPIFTFEDYRLARHSLKNYQKIMREAFKFFENAIFNFQVSDVMLAHTLIEMFTQLDYVAKKAGGSERSRLATLFVKELRQQYAQLYFDSENREKALELAKAKLNAIKNILM